METKKNPSDDQLKVGSEIVALKDFEKSPYFNESTYTYRYPEGETDALRIHLNAAGNFDKTKPTKIIFFALPAGNTIEQTVGAQKKEGQDWHYEIQHIGAQTRKLRETNPDKNIVVAYIEAPKLNANTWKKNSPNRGAIIGSLIEDVKTKIGATDASIDISGHSAGRSLKFAYIDSHEKIPNDVERISFLDSFHSYNSERGKKLIEWLRSTEGHHLTVISYDDRNITYKGKPVPGAIGYHKTYEFLSDLKKWGVDIIEEKKNGYTSYKSFNGRLAIIIMNNPENKILHTETVYRNGFIYTETAGTPQEGVTGDFNGPISFSNYIQQSPTIASV